MEIRQGLFTEFKDGTFQPYQKGDEDRDDVMQIYSPEWGPKRWFVCIRDVWSGPYYQEEEAEAHVEAMKLRERGLGLETYLEKHGRRSISSIKKRLLR